mmetsp:Transcript_33322/g.94829  ORF Transcript_33322/g.94829 Transcript_33322/m.94829 type:complete len:240 (+) Transcript_33322:87-806(+)
MIHVFNGCKEICALPGKACSACGDCCKSVDCKPCEECFKTVGEGCSHFTEKPLSTFVIVTWFMSGLELYYCLSAFSGASSMCAFPSDASFPMSTFVLVHAGFAGLNILFAPWFQHQVWAKIDEDARRDPGSCVQAGKVTRQTVQGAFKHVFLQDFGVLFYFFALLASFAWSWTGKAWVDEVSHGCEVRSSIGSATHLGMAFFWVATFYSVCWYNCSCCAGTVQYKQQQPLVSYNQVGHP